VMDTDVGYVTGVLPGTPSCGSCTHRPAVPGEHPSQCRAVETRWRPDTPVPGIVPVATNVGHLAVFDALLLSPATWFYIS